MPSSTPEVIELLETYLRVARERPFSHVAIAMCGYPNIAACDYGGENALKLGQLEALGHLSGRLKREIDTIALPVQSQSSASFVCYDLRSGSLGFDFIIWLVDQEMTRIREGASAPLRVGFWKGRDGRLDTSQRMWLDNVFRPALKFIGAVEDESAVSGRRSDIYVPRNIVAAVRNGEKVPIFHTDTPSLYPGTVTITLREAAHDTHRNSNLQAWMQLAELIEAEGEQVVFVRDTAKAYEPLPGFDICPKAAIDLDARMALYQNAKANLFISNGPIGLALFTTVPWFQMVDVEHQTTFTQPFWSVAMGVEADEQLPWCLPSQRIVWKADSYENLIEAWNALRPLL